MSFYTKVGSFNQPNITGAQSFSGFGFQPKLVLFFMTGDATGNGTLNNFFHSFGAATASSQFYIAVSAQHNVSVSKTFRNHDATHCIGSLSGSALTINCEASFTSMDADGFTINWTTATSTQRLVSYAAFGGTDITNATIGSFLTTSSTGTFPVTGVGFKPSLILFSTTGNATAPPSLQQNTARVNLSMVNAIATKLSSCGINNAVSAGTPDGASYQRTDEALAWPGGTGVTAEATLTSLDSDGFTLNFSTASAAVVFYVAIAGSFRSNIGSFNQPVATGNSPVTGVGFTPKFLLLSGVGFPSSSALNMTAAFFEMGFTDSGSTNSKWTGYSNGGAASVAHSDDETGVASGTLILVHRDTAGNLAASSQLTSLDSDGFTLNWGVADSTAREFLYLAIAENPTPPATASGGIGKGKSFNFKLKL